MKLKMVGYQVTGKIRESLKNGITDDDHPTFGYLHVDLGTKINDRQGNVSLDKPFGRVY